MGRAEIRKQVRQGQVMTVDEHNKRTARELAVLKSIWVRQYSACMATVLRDKFGFGLVRCKRFIEHLQDLMDSVQKGYVDIDDLNKALEEEIGLKIE